MEREAAPLEGAGMSGSCRQTSDPNHRPNSLAQVATSYRLPTLSSFAMLTPRVGEAFNVEMGRANEVG